MEVWKEIPNMNGVYLISNSGVIKNAKTNRIIKTVVINTGYLRVGLNRNSRKIKFLVHRLVLMAFNPIANYNELQINHKNKIKTDNRLENLEWVTVKQNIVHKYSFEKEKMVYVSTFLRLINDLIPFNNIKIA